MDNLNTYSQSSDVSITDSSLSQVHAFSSLSAMWTLAEFMKLPIIRECTGLSHIDVVFNQRGSVPGVKAPGSAHTHKLHQDVQKIREFNRGRRWPIAL